MNFIENFDRDQFLKYMTRKDGNLNTNRIAKNFKYYEEISNWLNKYFNYKYNDNISLMLHLLKDNLNEVPKCKNCGKPILTYYFKEKGKIKQYCSNKCSNSSPEKIELRSTNYFNKTGFYYSSQNPDVKEKVKETLLKNYGVDCIFKNEKTRNSIHKNLGVDYPFQSKNIQDKIKETNQNKYGVKNQFQRPEIIEFIQKNCKKKCFYDNQFFDSGTELAFYIYYKDKGFNILKCPYKIKYNVNNKIHYYFPDFLLENKLIEIKGDNLINDVGILCDRKGNISYQSLMKTKCMWENNVIVILDSKCDYFKNYVKNKYGKNFIKNCKVKKEDIKKK